jgi:hypothetical protein
MLAKANSPAKEHDENSKTLIYIYTMADEGWMSFLEPPPRTGI